MLIVDAFKNLFYNDSKGLGFIVDKYNSKYLKGSLAIGSENYIRLFPSMKASKANLDGCFNNYASLYWLVY